MALYDISQSAGVPPLLWSNVKEAFDKINQNFSILAAEIGSENLLDFKNLNSDVTPAETSLYQLGVTERPWKSVHAAGWTDSIGSRNNGIWAGAAQIKGINGVIDLPANSTVNGSLIIDPAKSGFKNISIAGQELIVADQFSDTLTLQHSSGIEIRTVPETDTIIFENKGVTNLSGTPGQIGVSSSTGTITLTNLGVLSVVGSTEIAGRTPGAGISATVNSGNVTITNTGIIDIQSGFGITVSTNAETGVATISNAAPVLAAFRTMAVTGTPGQPLLAPDTLSDILTFEAGTGITITTNDATDTITISATGQTVVDGGNANSSY